MKVLLCHPNQLVSYDGVKARPMVGPPLGLLLIAGYLRSSAWGGSIQIYDARLSAKKYLNKNNELIFGDTDDEIIESIRSSSADVVGISNMFSSQIERAYAFADLVRSALPKATVVIGGPHVSIFPYEALKHDSIDYAILGEGEIIFTELILALSSGKEPAVDGILSKKDLENTFHISNLSHIENLDSLPLPAYDLVDMEKYFHLARKGLSPRHREWGKRPLTLLTSRGCPHVCSFCSIHTIMGFKYRYHSPEYIKNHIEHLVNNYKVDFLHLEDDNLTNLPERYDKIIETISKLDGFKGWDTPNGVRGDTWTLERVENAKKSGCQFLTVAVESAVPEVLDKIIRKNLNLDLVINLMQWCKKVNLRLHAFYIIGFPGETLEQMNLTVKFALRNYWKYGVTPFLQPLIPIPNTPIYKKIIQSQNTEVETKYNQITTVDFNPGQVKFLYKKYQWTRILIFFFRTFTNWTDCKYNCKLMFKYPHAVFQAVISAINAKS